MFLKYAQDKFLNHKDIYFLKRLKEIFELMDQQYLKANNYYGFNCAGCEDNCCRTHFYHHTYLEYFYILEGFNTLADHKKDKIKARALQVCEKTVLADKKGEKVRLMCPLNFDGLCVLYPYRPMICRLHGIPHELKKKDKEVIYGSGCEVFTKKSRGKEYFKFDRTPFYRGLAGLEKEFIQVTGLTQKFKMTVAQMITSSDENYSDIAIRSKIL